MPFDKLIFTTHTILSVGGDAPVYNIDEQVYQLSPELKKDHPDIPWSVVSGLRHRLVHDYDGIIWTLMADVIFDDMAPFVR